MSSRSAVPSINLTDLPLAKARAALVKWPVVTMTTPAARCRWPEKSAPEVREEAAGVPWSGRGFGLEHDRIAEGIEAPDEPPGDPVLVPAIQVVGAKLLEVDGTGQHVEDGDQDLVGDRHGRLLGPEPRLEAVELVPEIGALGARRAHRGRHQGRPGEHIALAGAAPLRLAGTLGVGRAHPGPGGQ